MARFSDLINRRPAQQSSIQDIDIDLGDDLFTENENDVDFSDFEERPMVESYEEDVADLFDDDDDGQSFMGDLDDGFGMLDDDEFSF